MKSSDLFQRGTKPADPEPTEPNAPNEEPISVRKPIISDREDQFDRTRREPEPELTSPEPEPEVLTVDEMLEMEDEELRKYGIDDPHTWKAYQKLLNKKETEWSKERAQFEKTIANLKVQPQRNQEPAQPEPKPQSQPEAPLVKPMKPQRPVNYDYTEALSDPNSASAQYLRDYANYQEKNEAYLNAVIERQDKMLQDVSGYITQEQQAKLAQQRREQVKSQSLSRFQTRGLSAKDAAQLYDQIEQAYMSDAETGADIFVNLFKGGRNGSEPRSAVNSAGRRKLPDNIILPPGVNSSAGKPVESSSKEFMQGIQGGNQTRRIILNREKRK